MPRKTREQIPEPEIEQETEPEAETEIEAEGPRRPARNRRSETHNKTKKNINRKTIRRFKKS
jgi:hypothetical protein